jgi:hypothetical protein
MPWIPRPAKKNALGLDVSSEAEGMWQRARVVEEVVERSL